MKCKEVEKLLIEGRLLPGEEEMSALSRHLEECPECVSFSEHITRTRAFARELPAPRPPDALIARTLQACRTHLVLAGFTSEKVKGDEAPLQIPTAMWGVLIALLALTVVFLAPVAVNAILQEEISYPVGVLALIILQNIGMLLFAPIILRNIRLPVIVVHSA